MVFLRNLEKACKRITKSSIKYNKYIVKRGLKNLKKEDILTYKLEGFDIGFALKRKNNDSSNIIAIYNASKHSGIGYLLIQAAIDLGGKYLEHFEKDLISKINRQSGFKVFEEIHDVDLHDSFCKQTVYRMELSNRKKNYNDV